MKTWEIYKYALENSNAKFKSLKSGKIYKCSTTNILIEDIKNGVGLCVPDVNEEWELIKEPVSWQEAIEEWRKDKDIYVIVGETRYEQSGHECLGIFTYINSEGRKEKQYGFFILMFTDGKWYIDNNSYKS